jgi:hypothetical protein
MGTPKVMKLLDPGTGLMECKVCGARHLASIRPDSGGRYYRGAWQCQNGCKLPEHKPFRLQDLTGKEREEYLRVSQPHLKLVKESRKGGDAYDK